MLDLQSGFAVDAYGLDLVLHQPYTVATPIQELDEDEFALLWRSYSLLLLPWALGGRTVADYISRKAVRYILADGLYPDLARDKLDGGTPELGRKLAVGRVKIEN